MGLVERISRINVVPTFQAVIRFVVHRRSVRISSVVALLPHIQKWYEKNDDLVALKTNCFVACATYLNLKLFGRAATIGLPGHRVLD